MENLCTACLSSGRNLYFIRETGFYHLYSQILNEMQVYDISELCIRVCWECRALLRRLQLFKQQVKRSYTELMEYTQNSSKHPQPGTPRLQISHVNSHNYPEVDIKMEMDDTQYLDDQLDMTADETHCEPETFANELDVAPKKQRKDTKKVVKLSIGTRPSSEQLECLVGFLELNPNIAKGLLRTVSGKVETRQKWDMIATKLSSLDGVKKDGRAWAKYWAEKKFYIKKQLAQLSSSPTSGMLDDMPTLDRRFLAVMGGPRWHGGLTEERCPPVNPTPEPPIKEKPNKRKIKQEVMTPVKKRIYVKKKKPASPEISEDDTNADVTYVGDFEKKTEAEEEKLVDKDVSFKESARLNGSVKAVKVVKVKEVLPERPQCAECGKHFSSRKTYKYHLNVLHKGQNRHPCPRCGKVYQWKSNLGRHLRSHKARDSGELYCETCDKRFASVATYRQHLRVSRRHVAESDFSFMCNECGKKFVNKTRLRDHIDWEHLKKIKFRCQLCNKPFKCHTSLYVHKQNVHMSKESKNQNLCHVCGKSYQNAAKLKYHIVAMHTSETPYRCAHCSAAFGWYSSLYRHVREVHYKMKLQPKKSKKSKKSEVLPSLLPPQVVLAQMNQAGPP